MTRTLYVDLHNLITDCIGEREEQIEDCLNVMAINANNSCSELFRTAAEQAAKCQKKKRELENVLARFEEEVEEPMD